MFWTSFRGRPGRRRMGAAAVRSCNGGLVRKCSGSRPACTRKRYELPSIGTTTAWCSSRSSSAVATTASPKMSAHSPKPRLPVNDHRAAPDGLGCFTAAPAPACTSASSPAVGKASVKLPQFRAVNTVLSNLKTALCGTYRAFDFVKYAPRYLAEA
jgi:hypothetical protein